MSELPQLVSDLALILIVAGITTLLFKRLKQPLILGYILAGFLTGPHMTWVPTVSDTSSIDTWSSIGVIFIMFTLGLEFSFKKIVKMGLRPIIAAVSVITFMITIGSLVGRSFGWSHMNSLFLGGMLAMSSTTIIYKALDELGLRQKKFANVVLGVLILEDILGILLMVILSAMAVSSQFEGAELLQSFLKLGFFLVLWFVVGIFIVPLVLRRNSKWIGKETLLIVSVGLCFLLVVLATKAGYSSAFGAFMMGSILAETIEAESIERVVAPVKDLFGAIFFVSVGMLVDPSILVAYWQPIVVIVLAIIIGQALFGSLSFLISGHTLKVSMQCGFSLTQIGEFSFILAGLGVSLGVTSKFLYPVVVAVSIITTFTTPYLIKLAEPAYGFVQRLLPQTVTRRLEQRGAVLERQKAAHPWKNMLTSQFIITGAYLVLSAAFVTISFSTVLPLSRGIFGHWAGNILSGIITYVGVSIFLRPIVTKKYFSPQVEEWRKEHSTLNLILFNITVLIRFAIATAGVFYIIEFLCPLQWYWNALIAIFLTLSFVLEKFAVHNHFALWVKLISIRLERTFTTNLRSREIYAAARRPGYANTLQRHDVHLSELALPEDSSWGGKTLRELQLGHRDSVHVAAIIRGNNRINIPDGETMLFPCDRIEVIGDDESLQNLSKRMNSEIAEATPNDQKHHLDIDHFTIHTGSPLCGKDLFEANIRTDFQCLVVGFDNDDETSNAIDVPSADRVIHAGDTIWLVGESKDLKRLRQYSLPKKEKQE